MQLLAFRSVLSLARRPRGRVVTPIPVHGAALQSPVRRSPVPHVQTQLDHSSRTSPCQPGSGLVRVPKQVPPAAQPRPTITDTARFPDTRGSCGADALVYSAGTVGFTAVPGVLRRRAGLRLPGCPAAGEYPGVPRSRPVWPRGAVLLLLLLLLPPPAEAARPGPARSVCSWRLRSRGGGRQPAAMEH